MIGLTDVRRRVLRAVYTNAMHYLHRPSTRASAGNTEPVRVALAQAYSGWLREGWARRSSTWVQL